MRTPPMKDAVLDFLDDIEWRLGLLGYAINLDFSYYDAPIVHIRIYDETIDDTYFETWTGYRSNSPHLSLSDGIAAAIEFIDDEYEKMCERNDALNKEQGLGKYRNG